MNNQKLAGLGGVTLQGREFNLGTFFSEGRGEGIPLSMDANFCRLLQAEAGVEHSLAPCKVSVMAARDWLRPHAHFSPEDRSRALTGLAYVAELITLSDEGRSKQKASLGNACLTQMYRNVVLFRGRYALWFISISLKHRSSVESPVHRTVWSLEANEFADMRHYPVYTRFLLRKS